MIRYVLFLCCLSSALFSKPLDVSIDAESAILINAKTGKVLYAKNPHKQLPPASVSKMVLGIYALQRLEGKLHHTVAATSDSLGAISSKRKKARNYQDSPHYLEFNATHIGIKEGERLTYEDLIKGLMIVSGGDAANVLGKALCGSYDACVQALNQFCKGLGCKNTHLVNLHGLHDPKHLTTVSDMALVAKEAMRHPIFRKIVSQTFWKRPKTSLQESVIYAQSNRLLRKGKHFYPHATGIKIGYHSDAKHTIAASAKKDGREVIAVVFHAPSSAKRFGDATKLFDAAFAEQKLEQRVLSKGKQAFKRTISGGSNRLKVYLPNDIKISYYPSERPRIKAFIEWEDLALPIEKDQYVGNISIELDGKKALMAPVFALAPVEERRLEVWLIAMGAVALCGVFYIYARA